MYRGAFRISSAFRHHAKLTGDYGQNGLRSGTPSFDEYMMTAAGKAELSAFACRCTARFKAELTEQPLHLLEGAHSRGDNVCLEGRSAIIRMP